MSISRRLGTASAGLFMVLSSMVAFSGSAYAGEVKNVRVGWCIKVVNTDAVPWAVAKKMGYLEEEGLDVTLVPVNSGNDCVTFVANGELPYSLPAIEPLASIIAKGYAGKSVYTLFNGTTWRIAVPQTSGVNSVKDLKGKRIGVASMSSVMVAVTKSLLKNAGLDPEQDVTFVSVGAAASAALAAQRGEVDAFAMWDIADMQIERIGLPLRELDIPELSAPSLGLFTSAAYFEDHKDEATGLARAYAKGVTFTLSNPEAALDFLYSVYPETTTPGLTTEELRKTDLDFIQIRRKLWEPKPEQNGKMGYAVIPAYATYVDNLARWGMIPKQIDASSFITNELIDKVNDFDSEAVKSAAKNYTK